MWEGACSRPNGHRHAGSCRVADGAARQPQQGRRRTFPASFCAIMWRTIISVFALRRQRTEEAKINRRRPEPRKSRREPEERTERRHTREPTSCLYGGVRGEMAVRSGGGRRRAAAHISGILVLRPVRRLPKWASISLYFWYLRGRRYIPR